MEKDEICEIEDLKMEYDILSEKYNLPEFEKLSEDFDVEKVMEKDTSFLLREIRRVMSEKLNNYLHFFEVLLNPTSPPMFLYSMLKNLNEKDKGNVRDAYKKIAMFSVETMKRDTIYDEKKEAEFILEVYNEWQETKLQVYGILDKLGKDVDLNNNSIKKDYFG